MAPVIRVVERLLWPLRRRVMLMIGRAVVRLVDEASPRQRVQVEALSGEVLDDVERCQEYGYSSYPPVGSEAVLLSAGGMRQHPLVVSAEAPEYRPPRLDPGSVTLYTWRDGRRAGTDDRHAIDLDGGSSAIRIESSSSPAGVPAGQALVFMRGRPGGAIIRLVIDDPDGDGAETVVDLRASRLLLRRGRSEIRVEDTGITLRAPAIDMQQVS